MTKKLTPEQQAAKAEFAALDKEANRKPKPNRAAERKLEKERQAFHDAFHYDVPPWPAKLLDDVIEAMADMHVPAESGELDPTLDKCRDHFFLELVLRLVFRVPFETTAEFLGEAIDDAIRLGGRTVAATSDPATQKRREILAEALSAFCNAQRGANKIEPRPYSGTDAACESFNNAMGELVAADKLLDEQVSDGDPDWLARNRALEEAWAAYQSADCPCSEKPSGSVHTDNKVRVRAA